MAELVLDKIQNSLGGKQECSGLMNNKPMLLLLFFFSGLPAQCWAFQKVDFLENPLLQAGSSEGYFSLIAI